MYTSCRDTSILVFVPFGVNEHNTIVLRGVSFFKVRFSGLQECSLIEALIAEGQKQNNHYALASAYNALIWDSIDGGKYKEGASFALKAQEHYSLAGEKQRELQALNGEASALKASGKFDHALTKYLDGLEQAKDIEDQELVRLFLTNLGGVP